MELDSGDIERIKKHLGDVNWRLRNLYYIKDKNGNKVLFKPNKAQEKFLLERHGRDLILKVRQLGFTTLECIYKLDKVIFNSYIDAGIVAHTVDDAEKIFTNKVKFAYDNLPEWLKRIRKPNIDRAGELRFPNNSSIAVSSNFRGGTLAGGLHVSEYGKVCSKFPEKAREIKSGALNAVPLGSDVVFESTAEGASGDFYEMFNIAARLDASQLTEMDFKAHFFPWWDAEEYRLNPTGITIPHETITYFKMLKDDHGIDLDDWQKAWYFKKSVEQGDDMHREYPSYPEEAFMASGRPVFNQQKLARDIRRAKEKSFETHGFLIGEKNRVFKIFKQPSKEEAYSVGADIAEGLEIGDSSTFSVLNKNFDQVAAYKGKIDPDEFGRFLVQVSKFYNNALLAPEVNNAGIAVIESIKREKYFNVYTREVREELGRDMQSKIGWHTNTKTKMLMIDELKAAYRDDSLTINDQETLREMMTLTIEEDGNVIMNGKDLTVALAIAIQALKQTLIPGEYKAFVPVAVRAKDVTKMSVEEKLKHYKRAQRV